MIAVGARIGGRFRVDEIIGAGGMGVVVRATHLELGHGVAIKLLRDELAGDATLVERFLREARSVVNLRTEHVGRVTDVGRLESGAPYMVMELLAGTDLHRALAAGPLPPAVAVEYVLQACVGLAEAHAAGVIHRDLKPANLFLTRRIDGGPLVKVLDFGIAKALDANVHLTRTVGAMGSPGYMSPEQLRSARDVDVRTDIWALGVTLYQLLAARMPFAAATATEIAVRVAGEPPDALDVDPMLRAVVLQCLAKAPAARFADVVALAGALVPFGGPAARGLAGEIGQLAGRPVQLAPEPGAAVAVAVAARASRRGWLAVPVIAAVVAAAAGAVAVARHGSPPVVAIATDASVAPAPAPDAAAAAPDAAPAAIGGDPFAQARERARRGCVEQTRPDRADAMPPATLAMCWCMLADEAHARPAYARLTDPSLRASVRQRCAQHGITLE